MTWFRVGGGGVPASLKHDMNVVLNKKFHSLDDYDPDQWPGLTNLLGKLPEATVSGAIANITDGADRVPTKNFIATIAPTLTGVSSVNVTQTGKNLLPNNATSQTIRYCDFTVNADGSVTANGTVSGGGAVFTLAENVPIKAGNYVLSGCVSGGGGSTWELQAYIGTTYYREYGTGKTFTVSENTTIGFAIIVRNNATISNETFYPMLEVGSTPSTYEKYAPTVSTISLGRTIYGGSADIVNGTGTDTHGMLTLTAEMINNAISYTYNNKNGVQISSVFPVNVIRQTENLCYVDNGDNTGYYVPVKQGASAETSYMWFGSTSGNKQIYWIGVLDDMNMTLEEWKTWALTKTITCVYTLPTPETFTFPPITPTPETALGVNNFWHDAGDTSVTYRRDIDLALAGT